MRVLRPVMVALAWAGVSLLAVLISAVYHAQLPIARRIVRDALGNFVNSEIKGELEIGRFDTVSLHHVIARHVTLYDEQGRKVIVADRVDLYPEFSELRANTLRFKVSRLTNGFVRLIDDGSGTPTWIAGLEPREKGAPSANPLRALLDRIEVSSVTVHGDYLGLQGMRVEDVQAVGRLEIHHEVEVRIDSASGTFVQPFGFLGRVDGVKGSITTDPVGGIDLRAHGHREVAEGTAIPETEERVSARIQYKSQSVTLPQELRLEVEASEIHPQTLRQMGFGWIGPVEAPLRGRLELFGPPGELAVEAKLESPAGAAQVTGTLSDTRGISVHVSTDAVVLDKLVPGTPPLTLRGSFHIAAPDADTDPHVRVALASTQYKGFVVPAFEADGILRDDGFHIEHARSTQGGRLTLRGVLGFDGGTDLRVDANLPSLHHEPNLSRYVDALEGQLIAAVRIRVPGQGRAIDIDGKIELVDAHYASITASRIVVLGTARGDPQLPRLDVQVHGENVRLMGYLLGTARFSLRGGPHEYLAQGEFSPVEGQKTFYFDAKVAASRTQFVLQADPIEFVVGDKTFRGLARDLTVIEGKSVSLGLLRLASGSQRLEASGILRVKGEDSVRAELQNFDLSAVHALLGDRFPLSEGNADATLELRGDIARPELQLQGAMRGAKLFGIPAVGAMYYVTYENGHLELDNEVEVGDRGSVHLSGTGALDPAIADPLLALQQGRYDLQLATTDLDLTILPALSERLHSGRVTGTLAARGTLAAPSFEGDAAVASLCFPGTRPVDVNGTFAYDGAALSTDLHVKDGAGEFGEAKARAELPWARLREQPGQVAREVAAGTWELKGQSLPRPMAQLPFDLPDSWLLPLLVGTDFEVTRQAGHTKGSLRFSAQAAEQFHDANCELSAGLRLDATVDIDGDRIKASFDGQLEGKSVTSGEGGFEAPLEAWLNGAAPLTVTRADLIARAAFEDIQKVPVLCRHGRGDLHVDLKLESLFTPEQRAQMEVVGSLNPHVRVLEGRQRRVVESCRDDPARVWFQAKVDGQQGSAQGWMEGCYGGHTDITALVPLRWPQQGTMPGIDDSRDTRVQLNFAESQLRPLLDRMPGVLGFGATANGKIIAVGNKQRVQYTGTVHLTDGKLYVLATGQELSDLRAKLVGNGSWAKIETFSAKADDGKLEAAGGIGFDRWLPARLQLGLVLANFPVQREGLELAVLNGSAALSTEIGPKVAKTAIKLHSLAIRLPSESSRSLQGLEPHSDVVVTTEKREERVEKPYVFEIFVDGQRGLSATRNDFDVALATELALSYEDPVLHVGGYVEFRRGTFEVFGKQFDVNRGSLQFDGGTELNPEVNLVATQRPESAGSPRVVAQVSGTLAQPVVEFYSETCPGQGAIVQLVSGRCPSEEDTGLNDTTGAQNAFAAGIVGGILTLGARRELGGLIPRIAVESTGQGTQTRVKAGFEAVPKFMRGLVQRVYVQGALSTSNGSQAEGNAADSGAATPDFLIELYFPHNIVGAARVVPRSRSWGLDVTWEP